MGELKKNRSKEKLEHGPEGPGPPLRSSLKASPGKPAATTLKKGWKQALGGETVKVTGTQSAGYRGISFRTAAGKSRYR